MNGVYTTNSYAETRALGRELGRRLCGLDGCAVIAYTGGLGMGKTAFTGGLAEGLGIGERVVSPTFAIVNEYSGLRRLCHFDTYRLSCAEELEDIGWYDYLREDAVIAVEWSENVTEALPADCIRVDIRRGEGQDDRIITISGLSQEEKG